MVLIGLAVWLVIAGFYAGVTWAAVVRRASPQVTRALLALVCALAMAPAGCVVLYVPIHGEVGLSTLRDPDSPAFSRQPVKPRYLDSFELSYALPFATIFVSAWWLSGRLQRLSGSPRA